MDLEKAYDKVNMEVLWQVLKMYDRSGKLLNGIKSMYVDSLTCIRVKRGENEWFRIDSDVRQGCIKSPWLFNVYMDSMIMKEKMGIEKRGMRFQEKGRE